MQFASQGPKPLQLSRQGQAALQADSKPPPDGIRVIIIRDIDEHLEVQTFPDPSVMRMRGRWSLFGINWLAIKW